MSVSAESVARAFVQAINTHDVNALVELMLIDHVFVDSLGTAIGGKETMRKGWEGYFRMVPDYTLTIEETYSSGDVTVMLGVAHGTYTTDGRLLPENEWKTPGAFKAVIEDGKVKEWRVYADNEPIRQLMSKNQTNQ
jgi:ketosteroid isomerase-like protein